MYGVYMVYTKFLFNQVLTNLIICYRCTATIKREWQYKEDITRIA